MYCAKGNIIQANKKCKMLHCKFTLLQNVIFWHSHNLSIAILNTNHKQLAPQSYNISAQ
jgi:hypothetical protein